MAHLNDLARDLARDVEISVLISFLTFAASQPDFTAILSEILFRTSIAVVPAMPPEPKTMGKKSAPTTFNTRL